jgi:hypothetical protein
MTDKKKELFAIYGAIAVAALFVTGLIIYRKNKKELQSNLVDDMLDNFGKPSLTQFVFKNDTASPKPITLFDAYNTGSAKGMGNSNLAFFNKTLLNEPKRVKSINITANGTNAASQINQIMTKVCKDASGNASTENYVPMISTMQVQANMTSIQPNNLVLDGECFLDYVVQPKTTVIINLDYDTLKK